MTNLLIFPSSENALIFFHCWSIFLLGINPELTILFFQYLRNVPFPPSFYGFWCEIHCHFNCFSLTGKVSFFFCLFQDFFVFSFQKFDYDMVLVWISLGFSVCGSFNFFNYISLYLLPSMGSVHLYLFMTTFSAMLFLLFFRDPNDVNVNFFLLQSHLSLRLCYHFICFQSIFSIVQIGQCLLFYFPVHWFFFLSFCCLFHSLLVFTLVFVFLSCKISIWFFVIFVYLLTFYFFAESLIFLNLFQAYL